MRLIRGLLAVFGTAIVGFGLTVGLGVLPPVEAVERDAVDLLGTDYLLVATIGLVAAFVTLLVVVGRAMTGIDQLAMPDPEELPPAPRLGEEFDRFVEGPAGFRTHLRSDAPARIHEQLREAAIMAVMRRHGCPREAARRQVEAGEWTDDVEAAAYLGGSAAPRPPWSSRCAAVLAGRTWDQRGAGRAAQAIVDLAGDGDRA